MKVLGAVAAIGLAANPTSARPEEDQGPDDCAADGARQAVDRHGPMRTGRFTVQIDDVEVKGWQSVTLPGSSTEEGQYREGDDPDYEKKLWGQTTFDDLEMERNLIPGDARIREWRDAVREGRVDEGRKEIAVTLLDEEGQPQIQWQFHAAWPKEYVPPDLDASADGDVATESITVAYDRMVREEL